MASEVDNPGPSTSSSSSSNAVEYTRNLCCTMCRKTFHTKEILRLVIRERAFHVSVLIIRLNIRNGIVTSTSTKIANFLKVWHDEQSLYPTLGSPETEPPYSRTIDALDCMNTGNSKRRFCFKHNRKIHCGGWTKQRPRVTTELEDELMTSFIKRFAENLCLETFWIDQSIDNVLTSFSEVLADLDLQKLRRMSRKKDCTIEDIITNMFWQPRAKQNDFVLQDNRSKGWFSSVDNGCVVPLYSMLLFHIGSYNAVEQRLLLSCIHAIERSTTELMSWYLEPYFYDADVRPQAESYAVYAKIARTKKIENSLVTVVNDNPLLLGSHFAHVVASNFYSNQRYLREYLCKIDFLKNPIIYLQHNAPFIVRSLNPQTRMHIFHMIYKDKTYDKPTYENLYRLLVLLRDVMLRMHIYCVVMPKIGCRCDRLHFSKVLEMIKYAFLDSHVKVIIGLKNKRWWCISCAEAPETDEVRDLPSGDIRAMFEDDRALDEKN